MFFNSWKRKNPGSRKKSDNNTIDRQPLPKKVTEEVEKVGEHKINNPSLIGRGVKVSGEIATTGELQIDGIVEGEIAALKLVIEQSAKIIGSVSSDDLVIKGRIIGPVFGKKVRFGATARVEGDTFHETIAIEDGAYYEGSIKRHGSLKINSSLSKGKSI